MKRSEINRYIAEADAFFAKNHFELPPYAHWTPEEWKQRGEEADEVRNMQLGGMLRILLPESSKKSALRCLRSAMVLPMGRAQRFMRKRSCLCGKTS